MLITIIVKVTDNHQKFDVFNHFFYKLLNFYLFFQVEHCRSQSLSSLEHIKIMDTELPPFAQESLERTSYTTGVFHCLHLRKSNLRKSTRSNYRTKVAISSTCAKDNAYIARKFRTLNGSFCGLKTANDNMTSKNFFATSQAKQQKM